MINNKIIELKNVSKNYFVNGEIISVLKDVNLSFYTGKLYAIVGPSGAGKSTLIKLIGMMDNPSSGEIIVNNKIVSNLNDIDSSNMRNTEIGFVFQDYLLDENLTVYENILLPALKKHKEKEVKNNIIEYSKLYKLDHRLSHFPKQLSGGESQRVAICRALINNPNIILADEPTGNLDKDNEKNVLKALKDLSNKGKCVIVVSHSDKLIQYADIVLKIENCRVGEQHE